RSIWELPVPRWNSIRLECSRRRWRMRCGGSDMKSRVDLPVSGMTCAACARTIERTLANTEGVDRAQVNFATATATVEYDPARIKPENFVGAIEDLGYGVPKTEAKEPDYRWRLWIALICSIPVVVLGMSHRAPWVQLALSLPVMLYAAFPFFHGAVTALRHRSANMNTLIALGTGTAFLYSVSNSHEVYY